MNKLYCIVVVVLFVGCNNNPLQKPENLIDQETMENIFYDLTILEAVKSQNPYDSVKQSIHPKEFIYKKYNIDSVQYVKSNQYYISQIELYKRMFESVNERLQNEKTAADEKAKKSGASATQVPANEDVPQIQ